MNYDFDKYPCTCPCHTDDVDIFCSCFVPCCDNPRAKYRNADGALDKERFEASRNTLHRKRMRREEMQGVSRRPGKCTCGLRWDKQGFCPECDRVEKQKGEGAE